jgi:hypothetical protein
LLRLLLPSLLLLLVTVLATLPSSLPVAATLVFPAGLWHRLGLGLWHGLWLRFTLVHGVVLMVVVAVIRFGFWLWLALLYSGRLLSLPGLLLSLLLLLVTVLATLPSSLPVASTLVLPAGFRLGFTLVDVMFALSGSMGGHGSLRRREGGLLVVMDLVVIVVSVEWVTD